MAPTFGKKPRTQTNLNLDVGYAPDGWFRQPPSWNHTRDSVWWSQAPLPPGHEIPWTCSQDFSLSGAQARRPSLLPQTHSSPLPHAEILHPPTVSHSAHVSFLSLPALETPSICLFPFFYPLNPICHRVQWITDWNKSWISPNLYSFLFLEQTIFTKYLQCSSLLLISECLMNLPRLQNTCM